MGERMNKIRSIFRKDAARVALHEDKKDIDYKVLTGQLTELADIKMTASQLNERRIAYNAMTQLKSDSIMGPTFEVYATTATTTNLAGDVIWCVPKTTPGVDSEKAKLAAISGMAMLAEWNLNQWAYWHIIEMVTYGNCYLKTTEFVKPTDTQHVVRLNQRNPNKRWNLIPGSAVDPGDIYELAEEGQCVGFVTEAEEDDTRDFCKIRDSRWAIQSTDAIIHLIYNPSLYSTEIDVEDQNGETTYEVVEGEPPFIAAYTPAQILSLLEDALVANRVTRSALVRILQVEVGDCSAQEEDRTLDKIQRGLEHKLAMNTQTGSAQSYSDPGPLEKIIYTATRDGKGAINLQTLGGDVNVRDIVDLDYFKDKITSITDVSPGNLGQSTDEGGTGGATILTQNNIRLYRKIVTLQNSYASGIEHALNLYWEKNGLSDYVGLVEVKMQKPLGPEDTIKSQLASEALSRANDIIALCDALGVSNAMTKTEAIKEQLGQIDSSLYTIISSDNTDNGQGEEELIDAESEFA